VVDAYGMAESAGAIVKGFSEFRAKTVEGMDKQQSAMGGQQWPGSCRKPALAGVIFNRVGSESHCERLKQSVEGVPVFGCLPRSADFGIPHRHLGLFVAEENPIVAENIDKLAETVLSHVDMDAVVSCSQECGGAGPRKQKEQKERKETALSKPDAQGRLCYSARGPRIAVAYDKAFCFYYRENLDMLRDAGAELVLFSPLAEPEIPEGVDLVYIGGGYPELFAAELSANSVMTSSVKEWAETGRPLYAECGGLMYLSEGITDFNNKFFTMAGIYPFKTKMKKEKNRLGYRSVTIRQDCLLGPAGTVIRGHEFHYSGIDGDVDADSGSLYSMEDGSGRRLQDEGWLYRNSAASYVHLHFAGNPHVASNIIASARGERWSI